MEPWSIAKLTVCRYAYQGQYVVNPSYLGVGEYTLQTIGNSLAMASALIAAALYGNIGIKVLYNNICKCLSSCPLLHNAKLTSASSCGTVPCATFDNPRRKVRMVGDCPSLLVHCFHYCGCHSWVLWSHGYSRCYLHSAIHLYVSYRQSRVREATSNILSVSHLCSQSPS